MNTSSYFFQRQRAAIHLLLLIVTALSLLLPAAQPAPVFAATDEIDAVGDHALALPGARPPASSGDLDQTGFATVAYSDALNPGPAKQLTIEAWVKRSETNRAETILGNGWQSSYWFGFTTAGHLRFIHSGGINSAFDSNAIVPAGLWTHVAVSFKSSANASSAGQRALYINGALDKSESLLNLNFVAGPAGQPVGIGYDRNDFDKNYFNGLMDNLRVWKVALDANKIQSGMFQLANAANVNLEAEWRFDGNLNDAKGLHNAISGGGGNLQYVSDGALPHDIRIPQEASTTPALDGDCSDSAYTRSMKVGIDFGAISVLHTATDLWVCFDALREADKWLGVYLDPDYDRQDPAQAEDRLLELLDNNTKTTLQGTGAGGWTPSAPVNQTWDASYRICCGEFPSRSAEFRIAATEVGGWNHLIGLALGKGSARNNPPNLWPALAVNDLPSTWSSANLSGNGAQRSFTGKVVYQPANLNATAVDISGVHVQLVGSDGNGNEAIVDSTESSYDGSFSLGSSDDYARHRLEMSNEPQGFVAISATVTAPGVVIDPRTIDYGTVGAGAQAGSRFILGDPLPMILNTQLGPYFLILAPQSIMESGALAKFADFKRRLGFTVEIVSIESVAGAATGTARSKKIRSFELERRASYGERFKYLLLVGRDDVMPYARFPIFADGSELFLCVDEIPGGMKLTDWYYADLTSDFDSNKNGCLADGAWADPAKLQAGYTPDASLQFEPDVAVGRLPYNSAETVRKVLENSINFEQQSDSYKQKVLMGMSMNALKGYYQDKPCKDRWSKHCVEPSDNTKVLFDLGAVGDQMQSNFLNKTSYQATKFYENIPPQAGGAYQSPQPLSSTALISAMQQSDFGFVNLISHGGPSGVGRVYWKADLNNNDKFDSTDEAQTTELGGGSYLKSNQLGLMKPLQLTHRSIYILGACSTAAPIDGDNFAAGLLSQGNAVASMGAVDVIGTGSWLKPDDGWVMTVNYYVTQRLLDGGRRLGDAFWWTLAQRLKVGHGTAELYMTLDGDPTLNYWGNPGGESTLAAWPMARHDAAGSGFLPLPGPEAPALRWKQTIGATSAQSIPPSPIVSNNGEVIAAYGSVVDVYRSGILHQRLQLDEAAYGTPALAADGALYVMDAGGALYHFSYKRINGALDPMLKRERTWRKALGGAARTSPVIGSDGYILVAYGAPMRQTFVRPDGVIQGEFLMEGTPVGAPVVTADRAVLIATATASEGRLYRYDYFCESSYAACKHLSNPAVTAPNSTALLAAYGAVYIGRSDGKLAKLNYDTLAEVKSFSADGKITAGPVSGPAGQVFIATEAGTLYSLTAELSVRWQKNIGKAVTGMPAFGQNSLYLSIENVLYAYNPHSGALQWKRKVGNGTGAGSAAVGYGRQVYVQTTDGVLAAYGEDWAEGVILVTRPNLGAINIEIVGNVPITSPLPTTPQNATAAAVTGGALINATASAGFLLERSENGGPWETLALLPPNASNYSDGAIQPNTAYAYRVQVLSKNGANSEFAMTPYNVQSLPALPPSPVLQSVTTESAEALRLQWQLDAAAVVDLIRIERANAAGGPFAPVPNVSGAATTTVDSSLAANTTYFYRAVALNASGESAPSNVASGKTRQLGLPTPQNVAAKLLATSHIEVSWTGAPQGAQAVVEYSVWGLTDYLPLATLGGAGPYEHNAGAPAAYNYRVKFVLGDLESAWGYTAQDVVIGAATQPNQSALFLPLVVK